MEKRTNKQNNSIHKLFPQIASKCVEEGIDKKMIIEKLVEFPAPVTEEFVKEVWRDIQFSLYGVRKTSKATTAQITGTYDVFNKFWGEVWGIHVPFPSLDELEERA